ncbi:DUF3520 domain-containing protein [bacterium]|nr:DUF3520 domain-containing protein [bacterium]
MKTRSSLAFIAITALATGLSAHLPIRAIAQDASVNVPAKAPHRILFGSFSSKDAAEAHAKKLAEKQGLRLIAVVESQGKWLVLSSFDFPSKERAAEWLKRKPVAGANVVATPADITVVQSGAASPSSGSSRQLGLMAPSTSSPLPAIESRRSAANTPLASTEKKAAVATKVDVVASAPARTREGENLHMYFDSSMAAGASVSSGDVWRIKPEAGDPMANDSERYQALDDNRFHTPQAQPLSTFSIDVDTASYSNVRRFLMNGQLPPADAVRTEELVNYFKYDYPEPTGSDPFSISTEVGQCPWDVEHRLVRIGLKARDVTLDQRPPANLVFLLDVSGSMNAENKLPLLKQSLALLVDQLDARDTVTIAVYAGASGMALPPTPGSYHAEIKTALDVLQAGGSTNGAAGIQLAYDAARENFIEGGINRVFLCTDGDFNVGVSNDGGLVRLVEDQAKSGVFLSVLGFGMGNYNDAMLEQITNKGNGNYAYIDTLEEARRALVANAAGTLMTVARDVKIQVEFNPERVASYRLVGYENRLLAAEDFNDDKKDAGEIGAGHAVTALYEVVPVGLDSDVNPVPVDPLKYQNRATGSGSDELLTVKLRHKPLDGDVSRLQEVPVKDRVAKLEVCSDDFIWAATVANFALTLRESEQRGVADMQSMIDLADVAKGGPHSEERAEMIDLMQRYRELHETK